MLHKIAQLVGDVPRLFRNKQAINQDDGAKRELTASDREFQRSRTDLQLEFVHQDCRFPGQLIDASVGGALLRADNVPPKGVIIEMHLPRITLPILAEVMRTDGDEFGVKFVDAGIGVLVTGWARGRSPHRKNSENIALNRQVTDS
jgi:hypothetical protein